MVASVLVCSEVTQQVLAQLQRFHALQLLAPLLATPTQWICISSGLAPYFIEGSARTAARLSYMKSKTLGMRVRA